MKIFLLVLCVLVGCASAWIYETPSFKFDFAISNYHAGLLNEKQQKLHGTLLKYAVNTWDRCDYYTCANVFDGVHVTCTATEFSFQADEPMADVALYANFTPDAEQVDEIAWHIDDKLAFKFTMARPFTPLEHALFGRELSSMRDIRISARATAWSCEVEGESDKYESFSVGYATSRGPAPTIVVARSLSFPDAERLGVTADEFNAAMRAIFSDLTDRDQWPILSIVHSCHTFSEAELRGGATIPRVTSSDEISRKVCASIRPALGVLCRENIPGNDCDK